MGLKSDFQATSIIKDGCNSFMIMLYINHMNSLAEARIATIMLVFASSYLNFAIKFILIATKMPTHSPITTCSVKV